MSTSGKQELPAGREGRDGTAFQVLLHEAPTVFFTPDDNEFDPNVMGMILRGAQAKESQAESELAKVSNFYLSIEPELVHRYQVKAHDILAEGAPVLYPSMMEKVMGFLSANHEDELSPDVPLISVSKHHLDFGLSDGIVPIAKVLTDTLNFYNPNQKKAKWSINAGPATSDFEIKFTPTSGSLNKGERAAVNVEFKVSKMSKGLRRVFTIDVQDGLRHFVVMNLVTEKLVFGVTWDCVEMATYDGKNTGSVQVPKVLLDMQRFLYERKALDVVGIFRLAADETEIPGIKKLINQGKFTNQCSDVNCISTLIKVWFREMPVPLLNVLPADQFINSTSEDSCMRLFETLPQPNKGVFLWLLDVMMDVAMNHKVNRMGSKAISIVVAPNLFLPPKDEDPMKSLLLSQKTVNFVNNILAYKLRTIHGLTDI